MSDGNKSRRQNYTYGVDLDNKLYESVLDEVVMKSLDGVFSGKLKPWTPNLIKYVAQLSIRVYRAAVLKRDNEDV